MTGKNNIDSTFDIVKEKEEARQKEIQNDILYRKQIRKDKERRYLEDVADIHKKYGYKVKEPELIKEGFEIVYPFNCAKCGIVKAYPYDYLNTKGKDNGFNKCSLCMTSETKRIKKCLEKSEAKCPCGLKYYCTDLTQAKHENSKMHLNGMKQININNGKIYDRDELRLICSYNSVKNYGTLSICKMIDAILKIEDLKIPKDLL